MILSPAVIALYSAALLSTIELAAGQGTWVPGEKWGLKGQLVPADDSNLGPDYGFGSAIALSGDTALVGSYQSDALRDTPHPDTKLIYGEGIGSARVFVRPNSNSSLTWDQQAHLIINDPDDTDNNPWFGYAVALDGDTALVGAFKFKDMTAKAFIFVRSGSVWTQEAVLTLDDDVLHDANVPRVALEGNTAVVGTRRSLVGWAGHENPGTGSVYVFERSADGVWGDATVLVAKDAADGDHFGTSVAISGDSILIGADEAGDPSFLPDKAPKAKGKAYVFVKSGGEWEQEAKLLPVGAAPDLLRFGSSVALDGDTAIIGNHFYGMGGFANIFTRNNGEWIFQTTLVSREPHEGECFACSVDLQGGVALVGAKKDGTPGAYLYAGSGANWTVQERLVGGGDADLFSDKSVILNKEANTALITAHAGIGQASGSVFVFDTLTYLAPAPWSIVYLDIATDFASVDTQSLDKQVDASQSVDKQLIVSYAIGKDRKEETELLTKDCASAITGINITLTTTRRPKDVTHDSLSLAYDIKKSDLPGSNIWNNVTTKIEFCQIVRMIIPETDDHQQMVIESDKRVMTIDFDMTVGFEISDSSLGAGTVEAEADSASVASYVEACKCDGTESFTCDPNALLPNDELHICVRSTAPDVRVDFLDSLTITQDPSVMKTIENDEVLVTSITSRTYVVAMNGVIVSTRVPSNLFSFGEGSTITITGEVQMKLLGSTLNRRKLLAASDGAKEGDEKSPYVIQVDLGRENISEEEIPINSAASVAWKGIIMRGMVFVLTYYMIN